MQLELGSQNARTGSMESVPTTQRRGRVYAATADLDTRLAVRSRTNTPGPDASIVTGLQDPCLPPRNGRLRAQTGIICAVQRLKSRATFYNSPSPSSSFPPPSSCISLYDHILIIRSARVCFVVGGLRLSIYIPLMHTMSVMNCAILELPFVLMLYLCFAYLDQH